MPLSFRCRDFVVVWKKYWNYNYLFGIELLQYFLQLKKLLHATRKAWAGRMLCRPAVHQMKPLTLIMSQPGNINMKITPEKLY